MSGNLRILVVEDNPADADFIHELLPETGPVRFQVESVSRLTDALTRLERKGIDLVLLDLGLPDSQGLPTLHKLRALVPDLPVIVLTGTDDDEQAVAAVREGAHDYLVKGKIDGSLLARAARYAVERQKAVEALQHESTMRNLLLENLPCIAMILRKGTREIVFLNEPARRAGGVPGKVCYGTCAQRSDPCPFCLAPEVWATNQPRQLEVEYGGKHYEGRWVPLTEDLYVHYIFDITERKQAAAHQQLALEALRLLNRPNNLPVLVGDLIGLIQHAMGFDAVGLRIRQGEDFPYYVQNGFSDAFVEEENFLCAKGKDAAILRAADGKPVLECTCGLVLSGRTDSNLPCFTKGGSFWTNVSSELLALAPETDPRTNPRNRCIHAGYESVALIPLRSDDKIIGLLQFNDRRKGRFTLDLILFFEGLAASIGIALERRKAQEALQVSEQKYRGIFESSFDAITTTEPPSWKFTSANLAAVKMFGAKDEDDLISHGPWEVSPERQPDGRASDEKAKELAEIALREGHHFFEWAHLRIGGKEFPAEVLLTRMEQQGKVIVQGTIRDISERKQAKDALQKREADLQLAQKIGHIGSWESDLTSGALVWSDESYRIFGRDPAAFVPTREGFFQLVHPDDRARVREAVEESIRRGADYEVEHRIHRPDGTERVVVEKGHLLRDAQGKAARLMGTTQDITERKRAEQTLHDSQELYSSLVENLPQSVFRKDRKGRFLFVNQRFCEGVGHSLQDIVGKTDADLFPPQLAAAYHQDDLRVMESGQVLDQVEEHIGANGRKMYVQVVKTPLLSASRAVIGVQGIFWDITEQKELEMQYLRTQRLEAVGTMASGIAHDLNNILAPILMGAPMLRYVQNPAETAATLNAIESSAQRGADVVRQLLTFSRGQSGQRISLHLKYLLRDLRSILRETFPKNITFTLSEAPDLWPLVADPTQLHQILLNLCINARDAMPEGGTLSVTAANFQADDHYASMTTDARPGPYTHLQVSDTGTGIRPEDLDKIFDPFFTTKEVGKGTGLGLATVHRVVTGHGGFVRVHSQVGKGTTFDVYLPASPKAMAPEEPASPGATLRGHGQLILVVDDEVNIRQMTEKTLLRHGYRAVTATDGADAISVFAQYKTEVKAVLTDLMMPDLDGLGLVKVLAQMKPGLPVILSTGVGDDPERHQTFAAMGHLGVSIMLTKPYTADELLNALHAVLPAK